MWAHKIKNAGIEWLPAQRGQGMGQFWGAVTQEEVTALYDLSNPTASLVVASLQAFPQNAKEDTVTRWLKRYLIKSGDKMLSKFLRFATALDVLRPQQHIRIQFVQSDARVGCPPDKPNVLCSCYSA